MIIGISGKIGAGKDTLAQELYMLTGGRYQLHKFADALKEVGSKLTGTPLEVWYTEHGKNIELPEWGMTIGEFQQKCGTDAMRKNLHPDVWVLALFANYEVNNNWIISDVRFLNEAYAIKEKNGILIRLEGDPAGTRRNSNRDLNHPSETELDDYSDFDIKYDNVLGIDKLTIFAKTFIEKFLI